MSVDDDTGWTHWPAPAKLNLFLRITGRRADGYHRLQTVFRLLDWCDIVHVRPRDDGTVQRLGDSLPGLDADDDLAVRAARLLQAETGTRHGAALRIDKHIPAGGGFGGGSSDAATALVALNRLWNTRLSLDALAALGLRLGADVPVFVRGHNAWAEGVGELLHPIDLPPAWYLVITPDLHVGTAVLFADPDLTRDSPPATMAAFVSGAVSDNAFEPVLRRREPAIDRLFRALQPLGTPQLTGTGSGCFLAFASLAQAQAAHAALPRGLQARVVAGVARSPLLQALDALDGPSARHN